MLDIVKGDTLIVGNQKFPIGNVSIYEMENAGRSRSFARMAKHEASTERLPEVSGGGLRSGPAPHLTGLHCTPLDVIDSETQRRLALDTPISRRQTFITDGDSFAQVIVEYPEK